MVLASEGGRETHELDPDGILYATSEGNYTRILLAADPAGSVFIRGSLTLVERQLRAYPFLLRCHRAYIVNVRQVRGVTGNAQGLQLALEGSRGPVPVARGRVREFRSRLSAD